jgi:hypothetical protein
MLWVLAAVLLVSEAAVGRFVEGAERSLTSQARNAQDIFRAARA